MAKQKAYKKDDASMLALLKRERVNFDEAWRLLSPEGFLLKSDVSSYTTCYARLLMELDKEKQTG
jgi:hypothetical protein